MSSGDHSIVSDWLRTLGLSQYAESFVDNGYDDLEICKQIGDADLDAIGVTEPKHRERVLQAVRVLLEQGGTSVYFTLEEAARHSRVIADVGDDDFLANKASSASARPDSLRYFTDEYEEGKAELVRFPKMQLKMMIRDKMACDGIRLSALPYTNPDGSRGNLEQLAIRYAEELRTHYHDVLDRLEELRRRRVAIDFPPILDETDGSGVKPPQYYRPGKYMPSSCLQEPEDDPPYGVYGLPLRAPSGAASPQRCLSPRSKLFYEPCPLSMTDGGDGTDSGRGKKSGLSRLFRTLGSKKDKFKTSPRHIARLKTGSKAVEAPARTNDGACLPTLQPGDVLLGDEHCVQLMLAVRDGHLTMEQAVQRLRQRDTLRLRNHKNRDEMLNEFARSLLWSQSANKKAQANSIFYTDGLNIPACAGLHEQHAPIYYEPPDASPDVAGVGGLALHSRRTCGACVAAPTASSAVDHRFCTTLPRNMANSTAVVASSPFKAPPSTPLQLLSTSSTTAYSMSGAPEVCDGNCGNIMCSVRAAADSSPSPPAEGTTVLDADEIETETARCESESAQAEEVAPPSRTVPDVAHESELKRAAAAAGAGSESGREGASGAETPTPQQPVRGGKRAGMLGRLRSITSRSSYTSEEGQSQSSDYEDQEDIEKMAEPQRSEDQQRNSFVGRVKHLHKDVKKKISKFRNSRNSMDDGSVTDEKDVVEDSLQPGSSVESIPSGSAGSRSSLQAHTPSSSNRSSSSIGEEDCTQCVGPIVGRARALVDNTPSPYDKDGLPFKKGDIIDILSKNTTGTWVGMVNKKVGHFKFITVEEIPDESKPRQRKFPSVPKLDHRPETLDELLRMFGLQNYLNVLMLHGYQDLDVFKEVVKEDLDSLGITNHEHQLLIFQLAEMLLDYDGENLGEYTEVSASPDPGLRSSTDTHEAPFNDLDGGTDEAPIPSDPSVPRESVDSVVNGCGTVRYKPNIPVVEPRRAVADDLPRQEGRNGVVDASAAEAADANRETPAGDASTEVRSHIPRTFHRNFRRTSTEDAPSATENDARLSESPARIPYGSSFARKVRSSTLPRRDSDDAEEERATGRKGSPQDAKSASRPPSMPLGACIEHKLAAEGIDLCQEPYTDTSGFCGIPPALVQRYSEELQRDVADIARALDQVRICELCERGRHGVPNDFLVDSCHGPIVDADYSSLRNWLVSLGLPMYEPLFAEARVADLSQVADLREPDFRAIGVTNARHVRLLASAVGALHLNQSHASYR